MTEMSNISLSTMYKGPVSIDSLSKSLSGVVARWEKRKEVVVHSGMVSLA